MKLDPPSVFPTVDGLAQSSTKAVDDIASSKELPGSSCNISVDTKLGSCRPASRPSCISVMASPMIWKRATAVLGMALVFFLLFAIEYFDLGASYIAAVFWPSLIR